MGINSCILQMRKQRCRFGDLLNRNTASNVRAGKLTKSTWLQSHAPSFHFTFMHMRSMCVCVCVCVCVCMISPKSLEDCLLASFPSLCPSLPPFSPYPFLLSLSLLDDVMSCFCAWQVFFPGLWGTELLALVFLQFRDTQYLALSWEEGGGFVTLSWHCSSLGTSFGL